jgi:hypothetical protein
MTTDASPEWVKDLARLLPHAAARFTTELDDENAELLAELSDLGIVVPTELALFCQAVEDGSRIDLKPLGGPGLVDLCDLSGVFENNHPDEGTYGDLLRQSAGPRGVVLFGYGPYQLLFDTDNSLGGGRGAIWVTADMSVNATDATRLAGSLTELLAKAGAHHFD